MLLYNYSGWIVVALCGSLVMLMEVDDVDCDNGLVL
jgi:hypothetical protein